ncbi:hypothetical protein LISE100100_00260 [Listeria seeligeri]|uniref:hypothetical protein n=1 Tax=Listeria seeligeri TaxID=1640 RepID=UPI0001C4EC84|nr:hypothetical protein [Listeria seeligeri]CBH27772.1 hypothetical protein lse_1621 [Listeria seeligeri serovar 1/2b str. SLCC3954]
MDEIDMQKAENCTKSELRAWQSKIIKKIESNETNFKEKRDLRVDLRFLESVGNMLKGIDLNSQIKKLTVDEYKEMSRTQSDASIAKELCVAPSTLSNWKKRHNLVPYNKNMVRRRKK